MQSSEIAGKARFDHIRYAQLWEDADVLTAGLGACAGGTLVSRTRHEQRWVEGRSGTGHRLRQMFRYATPIDRHKTQFVLSSETFVAFNSTPFGQAAGFDQVRNFVGLNVPLAPKVTADIGYMNRYIRRRGAEDRMDHILPVTLVARF